LGHGLVLRCEDSSLEGCVSGPRGLHKRDVFFYATDFLCVCILLLLLVFFLVLLFLVFLVFVVFVVFLVLVVFLFLLVFLLVVFLVLILLAGNAKSAFVERII
jgi:hypothetical protein